MRSIAGLALGLLGCAEVWDLGQPLRLEVEGPNLDAAKWQAAFGPILRQLAPAAEVRPAAAQVVYVRWDDRCSCGSCSQYTVAHTERPGVVWGLQRDVWVCPQFFAVPERDRVSDTLAHELGRVLGFYGYLPCESGAMMTQYFNCRADHERYSAADVEAVREAGRVIGGVF